MNRLADWMASLRGASREQPVSVRQDPAPPATTPADEANDDYPYGPKYGVCPGCGGGGPFYQDGTTLCVACDVSYNS